MTQSDYYMNLLHYVALVGAGALTILGFTVLAILFWMMK